MRKWLLPLLSLLLVSCQTTDPGPGEQSAAPNLSALESSVEQYREAQQDALEQFQSAGQQLSQWSNPETADLQGLYTATVQQNNDSIEAATAVSAAIAAAEAAGETVFQEWQVEVDVYTDLHVKADGQAKLGAMWQNYQGMMQVLRQSEAKMDKVQTELSSNVEYFKDNLNTGGVAGRQLQLNALRSDIQTLVNKMKIALDSSDAFLDSMD